MEQSNASHPSRVVDIVAWVLVGAAATLTASAAFMAAAGSPPPPWTIPAAATVVFVAGIFAGWRHLQTVIEADDARDGYQIALASEVAARGRLSFARHAAALMATLPKNEGLTAVLKESLTRFGVEAAAVVNTEVVLVTVPTADVTKARAGVELMAKTTIEAGRAVAQELSEHGAHALTVPLRVRGQIDTVLVLWRTRRGFTPDDLDGLSLVARIVELSLENMALLDSVREQLDGTLRLLVDLVEQRLPNYSAYSETVAERASVLGRSLGMTDEEVDDLRSAAMLHDVGMLEIPESVLHAPRRLTADEQAMIRHHPIQGAELVGMANFPERVVTAIRSHHERWDGTGYPDQLAGESIPISSRILSICDAYVALMSDRPHRAAVGRDEAISVLRAGAGAHFDGQMVEAFVLTVTDPVEAADTPTPEPQ